MSQNEDVIDKICADTFPLMIGGIKAGGTLPPAGESFEFYLSYPAFSKFTKRSSERILNLIRRVAQVHGRNIKEHLLSEDLADQIIESNDVILESVGENLDEASGINKNSGPILGDGTQKEPKQIVSSWNRQKDKTAKVEKSVVKVKPQLMFKVKPDNSSLPFVPKLFEKPNAIDPLPQQLIDINKRRSTGTESMKDIMTSLGTNIDLNIYSHPYKNEILQSAPMNKHVLPESEKRYLPLDETPLTIVNTELSLNLMIDTLRHESEFAIDLEHHSWRSYQGFTCLIQISTRSADFIVDTLALRSELHRLNLVTTDPKICKIFHGGASDVNWLQKDFGVYLVNCFDTFFAAQKLNLSKQSYDYLLQHYCSIKVDKRYQLSDWRQRPLPLEMVRYAREDTHYLLYIFDRIRLDLEKKEKGLVRDVFKRSRELSLEKYKKKEFNEKDHLLVYQKKNRKKFNSQQLEAFKLMYAWRDILARSEDEGTDYVMPNHSMLQIAEILPREKQGILACFSFEPPLVKQNLQALHKLIKRARDTPLVAQEETILDDNVSTNQIVDWSIEPLHDWSKENNTGSTEIEPEVMKITVKSKSCLSTAFGDSGDTMFSKMQEKNDVEKSLLNPFNGATIPYDLFLPRQNKTEEIIKDDSIIDKIWKLKKVTEKPKAFERIKPRVIKSTEEELSINEMKHGKRKSTGESPAAKKARTEPPTQNIETKKFEHRDFKIFGSDKFNKNAKKNAKKNKGKKGGNPQNGPGGFTEPNFGRVKQKSTMAKGGQTHGSFTHSSKK